MTLVGIAMLGGGVAYDMLSRRVPRLDRLMIGAGISGAGAGVVAVANGMIVGDWSPNSLDRPTRAPVVGGDEASSAVGDSPAVPNPVAPKEAPGPGQASAPPAEKAPKLESIPGAVEAPTKAPEIPPGSVLIEGALDNELDMLQNGVTYEQQEIDGQDYLVPKDGD